MSDAMNRLRSKIRQQRGDVAVYGDVVIPKVGQTYTDFKTIYAVQKALVAKGYDLGKTGDNKDGVDGVMGPHTSNAIKQLQAQIGEPLTGTIDSGVLLALNVWAPEALPTSEEAPSPKSSAKHEGAAPSSLSSARAEGGSFLETPVLGLPLWQAVLGAVGVVAVGAGIYVAVKGKRK